MNLIIYIHIHTFSVINFLILLFILFYDIYPFVFLIVICCEVPPTIIDVALYETKNVNFNIRFASCCLQVCAERERSQIQAVRRQRRLCR